MKILIVGAGALGGMTALFLEREEVIFWEQDEEHCRMIDQEGLNIEEPDGSFKKIFPKCLKPGSWEENIDWVVVAVKAYQTEKVAQTLKKFFPRGMKILTLQNGWGNGEKLARYFEKKNIFLGVTSQGAFKSGAGKIKYNGGGETYFGPLIPDQGQKPPEFAEVFLKGAGFCWESDIRKRIWEKLLINSVINPLTGLLECRNGVLLKDPKILKLMERLLQEAMPLVPRTKVDITMTVFDRIKKVCELTADNSSSMLMDLKAGRLTEIDAINGAIINLAQEQGLEVPTHEVIYELIKAKEKINWKNLGKTLI